MSQERMIAGYDESMTGPVIAAYYGNSEFYNFGYWTAQTKDQAEASKNLVHKLMSLIPSARRGECILDVACGLGGSTRQLLNYYSPERIAATNISELQLARARRSLPQCSFHLMDATRLDFPSESFDVVICVEAAFHFDTRDAFLREACRILKPSGYLVHSDLLLKPLPKATMERTHIPNANSLNSPEALRDRLLTAGFASAEVFEATRECWHGFLTSLRNFKAQHRVEGRARERRTRPQFFNPEYFVRFVQHYVLACSRKAD